MREWWCRSKEEKRSLQWRQMWKKEDQEYFEDDKVKEVPAEPYKSEQGWVQKDEQGEVTEKLHLLRILEMIYIFKCKL